MSFIGSPVQLVPQAACLERLVLEVCTSFPVRSLALLLCPLLRSCFLPPVTFSLGYCKDDNKRMYVKYLELSVLNIISTENIMQSVRLTLQRTVPSLNSHSLITTSSSLSRSPITPLLPLTQFLLLSILYIQRWNLKKCKNPFSLPWDHGIAKFENPDTAGS